MHGFRGGLTTCRSALVALVAMLFVFAGATSAYAGGRDHGSAPGQEKWASGESNHQSDGWGSKEGDTSKDWQSDDKSGESHSDYGDKDCKKDESTAGEQTGEQGQPQQPPAGQTGGESQEGEKDYGDKEGEKDHGNKEGEKGEKGDHNKGGETPTRGGETPTQTETQPTPAPVSTAPVAPVQAQQTPTGGEVQAETEESPSETGNQGGESPNEGGRVFAENASTEATASESGLAGTGFDAWQLALLGAFCVAGSALLLRRTRRS